MFVGGRRTAVLAAGIALAASAGLRAADDPWRGSSWISSPQAKTGAVGEFAAPGTDWFSARVENRFAGRAQDVRRVTWLTTALGVYELYVNGRRVGDEFFLKPGFTNPERTRRSFSFDVTAFVAREAGARNVFSAEVSSGWWRDGVVGHAGRKSAFRGVLAFELADGTVRRVGTDVGSWRAATGGPVLAAGIFDGESYDARQTAPDFASMGPAEPNGEFGGEILPTAGAEVVLRHDLARPAHPVGGGDLRVRKGGTLVVDFGQNMSAVPAFRFRSRKGAKLTFLPGEMLNDADAGTRGCDGPKGSVYRANLRMDGGMRLEYVFGSDGVETYLPRFTYFGYRYAAITATEDVEIESLLSVPVTSVAKAMETGRIETGDPSVNRLIANVYWGQLSNYLSVPTDCPQRNERQGWTGDTQAFAETGSFVADVRAFFRKWTRDLRDTQRPDGGSTCVAPQKRTADRGAWKFGWADAGVIVPWTVWRQYGDTEIVRENWSAMERYVKVLAETKFDPEALSERSDDIQLGDWLSFEPYENCSGQSRGPDGRPYPETLQYWGFLGGCYWLHDARLMSDMAAAIGERDAAARYRRMAGEAKAYLKTRFFSSPDGLIVPCLRNMQTPALFALRFGLVEGEAKARTVKALRENFAAHGGCLQTGFLGTSILMDALTESGLPDLAYDLLLNHGFPGWLYSVDQGATTVWERWNSYTRADGFGPVRMNSFNHYAYGCVLAWLYKTAAGICADASDPGFRTVVMAPVPDRRLGHVPAEYRSAAGLVKSAWRYEGDRWIWRFTVPAGARARVTPPGAAERIFGPGDHEIVLQTETPNTRKKGD